MTVNLIDKALTQLMNHFNFVSFFYAKNYPMSFN